jgi:hypothetical protein
MFTKKSLSLIYLIILSFILVGCGGGSKTAAPIIISIDSNVSNTTLPLGIDLTATVTANLDNNTSMDVTSSVNWIINNTNVLRDNNGTFETVGVGSTVLTAQYAGYESNTTINVTNAELVSLEISPSSVNIPEGKTDTLRVMGTYTDDSKVNLTANVKWNISDTTVCSIDSGLVRGLSNGMSTAVNAQLNTITSNNLTVNVTAPVLESIQISPNATEIIEGENIQFVATGTYSNGIENDISNSVTWTSSDIHKATISANGLAEASAAGIVTIKASSGYIENNATLSITNAILTSIAVSVPSQVEAGWTKTLSATGTYNNGQTKDISTLAVWSSNDTSLATISENTVLGENNGTVTITATLDAQQDSANLTVIPEEWWNHMEITGGSTSTVTINGYVQSGSWKYFNLINKTKSSTIDLRVTKIFGISNSGSGSYFLNQTIADDLVTGQGVGYKVALNHDIYYPVVGYEVTDMNTNITKTIPAIAW